MGSLEEIRGWISTQPDFPKDLDDSMIERFQYVCDNRDYDVKEVMQLFFTYRNEFDDFFTNRDPCAKETQQAFEVVDFLPLPKLTSEGYQVYVTRLNESSGADKFDFLSYAKMFFNMTDVRMKVQPKVPIGDVPIFDTAGFSFRHFMKIMAAFSHVKKYMKVTQEVHPVNLVQIHVINTLPLVDKLLTFIRPIMRDEIKDMIHFHAANSNTLEEYIPKDVLPTEYGGHGESLKGIKARWQGLLVENRDWLMRNPWRGVDQEMIIQIQSNGNNNEDDEVDETFKTLSLD